MKKIRVLFVALASSTLLAGSAMAQTPAGSGVTRQQAITRLNQLIDFYQIDLSQAERSRVVTVCRDVQSDVLQPLSLDLDDTRDRYLETINSVDLSILFIANALRSMSEDSSSMDLASFHLQRESDQLQSSISVYARSLEEILIIDCQVFPEAFMAGLEEVRERAKVVESSAASIQEFIDEEFIGSTDSVRTRLNSIEARR